MHQANWTFQKAYQIALRRIIEEWKAALMALIEKGKRAGGIRKNVISISVAVT